MQQSATDIIQPHTGSRPWHVRLAMHLTVLVPVLAITGPAPMDIALSLVAAIFLVDRLWRRDWGCLHYPWMQVTLALILLVTLRNAFTDNGLEDAACSVGLIRYPLFAMAMSEWLVRDTTMRRRLWKATLAATAFLIIDAFVQYYFHTDLTGRPLLPQADGSVRLTGPFGMPRIGITILWLFFPLALPLLASRPWAGAVLAISGLLAIYLSGERTAMLLALLGLGLSCLLMKSIRRYCIALGAVAVIAAIIFSQIDPTLGSRQIKSAGQVITRLQESVYGQTWHSALRLGAEYPLTGVGRKQFQPNCRALYSGSLDPASIEMRCPMHAHNIYLEWLVEHGVPGLLLFLLFIGVIFRAAPQGWWKHPLQLGLMITLMLRFWPLAATPSQFVVWSAGPFWLVIGWLFSAREIKPDDTV